MKDYFEVLDIKDSAGEQAIRKAYEAMLRSIRRSIPEKTWKLRKLSKRSATNR
jgi:hypothetical protein